MYPLVVLNQGEVYDMTFDKKSRESKRKNCLAQEPLAKNSNASSQNFKAVNNVSKGIAIALILIGTILSFLMPLFAKLYQAFEFTSEHQCFTDSTEYIFRFPLLGILLIAILLLGTGLSLLYFSIHHKKN